MPGWEPFTALSLAVVFFLLGLARLSQSVVDSPREPHGDAPHGDTPPGDTTTDVTTDHDDVRAEHDDWTERTEEAEQSDLSTGDSSEADPSTSDGGAGSEAGERPVTISGENDLTPPTVSRPESRQLETDAGRDPPSLSTGALLANVALTQGLFGLVVAVGAWYFEIPRAALGLAGGPVALGGAAIGVGVVFGVLLWTANEMSATVADAVGAAYDDRLREMLAPDTLGGWLVLLGLILPTIAVVEELLFRAALIGVPAAGFGISPWALAIVSSMLFAFGHGAQGAVGIAVTGGLGFALAGGYILSGSLLVVVVAHYLVNALEFIVHEGLGASRLLS